MRRSQMLSCCWRKASHGFAPILHELTFLDFNPRESGHDFLHRLEFSLFLSDSGRIDQGLENRSRGFILIYGSLWMPLHRNHKVIRRCSFEPFDDSVLRRPGVHAQTIANRIRRLMMTGVYRNFSARVFPEPIIFPSLDSGSTSTVCATATARPAACGTGDSMCWISVPLRYTFKLCNP